MVRRSRRSPAHREKAKNISTELKEIRKGLGLTQEEFSEKYNVPWGTLRNWEQGRRHSLAAERFLDFFRNGAEQIVARTDGQVKVPPGIPTAFLMTQKIESPREIIQSILKKNQISRSKLARVFKFSLTELTALEQSKSAELSMVLRLMRNTISALLVEAGISPKRPKK